MDIANKIKNFFGASQKINNSSTAGVSGLDFLKNGNRQTLIDTSSKVSMSDFEFYKGYPYAALNNRANKVAQLAIENLKTDATKKIQDDARKNEEEIVHPYLTLIDESDDFTNTQFWYDISTYLDLEGVYYLMAVRTVTPSLVGKIQYFRMTSPYEIRRVINQDTREVGGYIETRDGMVREIPPEMIIPIRKLNPFSRDNNFAMTDAAKDSQFTLNQAGDFTRSSLKNNLGAPGIISTDVLMDREMFENFRARVASNEKGMPLFGNGTGSINWDPMQIDMDKAALMDITKINRDQLFAVTGVSPSTLGIDEAGTTRDVSRTQKEKFIEDHIMPQVQMIIDALNQDYKKYYKDEYKSNKYKIVVENPLGTDKDADAKDIENNTKRLDLYNALVGFGYEPEIAARYAEGEITLEELGEPTLEPELSEAEIQAIAASDSQQEQKPKDGASEDQSTEKTDEEVQNSFLALNRGAIGNPYRDSKGRFGTGPSGARTTRKMAPRGSNEKRIADAKKKLEADAKKSAEKPKSKSSPKSDSKKEDDKDVKDMGGKEAIKYSQNQKTNIDDDEVTIAESYQSIYYSQMNDYARKGAAEYSKLYKGKADLTAKEAKEWNGKMDKIISKNKASDSFYTYRVVASNKIKSTTDLRLIQDKGYMSTTVNKDGLKEIIGDLGGGKSNIFVLKIKVDKGQNGLFVDSATKAEYGEGEFLLPRDTKLTLGNKSDGKIGDKNVTFLDGSIK